MGRLAKASLQADWDRRTDLISLASEVRWYAAGDGTQNRAERKRSAIEESGQAGFGQGDLKGSREGKMARPERRRQTTSVGRKAPTRELKISNLPLTMEPSHFERNRWVGERK